MKKAFCKYCGGKLDEEQNKCTQCGRFNGSPRKPKLKHTVKINTKSKTSLIIFFILFVAVAVGTACGITYKATYEKAYKVGYYEGLESYRKQYEEDEQYYEEFMKRYAASRGEEKATEAGVFTLEPGDYIAGVHIPSGRYKVTSLSHESGSLNADYKNISFEDYLDSYTTTLKNGENFNIDIKLKFVLQ